MNRQRGLGVGDVVGERFRLVAEIAEGGMGRVYEAEDLKYDRRAAVKLISRRLARDPEFRARFEREAQAAARANHPNVLPVFDHGSEAGYLYLATQLADTDLGYLIEARGRLDVDTATAICGQMAWALDWAHARNVLHRDVKPENILLVTGDQSTHAYLADFGLARISDSVTLTQHGFPAGLSPAYASPEQWIGEGVTPASDQYALAATLYCCLAGHPPFGSRSITELRDAHLLEPPPVLDASVAVGAPAISAALAVALSKDPEDRYGSCQELIARVKEAAAPVPVDPGPGTETVVEDSRSQTENEFPVGGGSGAAGAPGGRPGPPDTGSTVLDPTPQPGGGESPAPAPAPTRVPPDPTRRRGRTRERRRVPVLAIVGVVVAVAVLAVAAALLLGGGDNGAGANSVAVGGSPQDVVADGSNLWVANRRDATLSHVSASSQKTVGDPLPTVAQVFQVAAAGGVVWALSADGKVAGYDETTGQPIGPMLPLDVDTFDVAAGHHALWIANGTAGEVIRIAVNGQVLAEPDRPVAVGAGAAGVASGPDRVWVASPGAGQVSWLDPDDGHVMGSTRVGRGVEDVVATGNTVWAANPSAGTLDRLDPKTGKSTQQLRIPVTRNAALTADGAQVAYVDLDQGVGRLIDASGHVRVLASPGTGASGAALTAHKLWITYPADNSMAVVSF